MAYIVYLLGDSDTIGVLSIILPYFFILMGASVLEECCESI